MAVSSSCIVTVCMHLLKADVLCICVSIYVHRDVSHHVTGKAVLCLAVTPGSSACACVHGQACLQIKAFYDAGIDEPCSLTLHQSTVVLVTSSNCLSVAQPLSRNRTCAPCKCNAVVKY